MNGGKEITAVCLGRTWGGSTVWKCRCGKVVYGIDALEEHHEKCESFKMVMDTEKRLSAQTKDKAEW